MKKILISISIFMLITTMICGLSTVSKDVVVKSSQVFHGVYALITAVICTITFFIKPKKA